MGSILASAIIAKASEVAEDEDNVIWTTDEALGWLNEAQRAICQYRADASVITRSIQLAPGTKQELTTAGDRRLMDVIRNMGENGATPGYAPRLVQRDMLDEFDPNWHAQAANDSGIIFEYVWDKRHPKQFYVNPPVTSLRDVWIEVVVATDPDEVGTLGDFITINDIYQPQLVDWICYRFFLRDAEENPNPARAGGHFQNFMIMLGQKTQTDLAVSPKTLEQVK